MPETSAARFGDGGQGLGPGLGPGGVRLQGGHDSFERRGWPIAQSREGGAQVVLGDVPPATLGGPLARGGVMCAGDPGQNAPPRPARGSSAWPRKGFNATLEASGNRWRDRPCARFASGHRVSRAAGLGSVFSSTLSAPFRCSLRVTSVQQAVEQALA